MGRSRTLCVLAALAVTVSACGGPTEQEVIDRNRGAYQRFKHQLDAIVATLPAVGTVGAGGCVQGASFDGIVHTTDQLQAGKTNTLEFVMERTIRYPRSNDPNSDFDVSVGPARTHLTAVIELYEHPLPPHYAEREPYKDFTEEIEAPLAAKYIVISRVLRFTRPIVSGDELFRGEVGLESFLIRVADQEILCSFTTAAESDGHVGSIAGSEEAAKAKLQESADDDLAENARTELGDILTHHTGYRFDLRLGR